MKHKAANRCRQVFAGRWAWSPEWKQYKKPVLMWRLVLRRFDKVKTKYICRAHASMWEH